MPDADSTAIRYAALASAVDPPKLEQLLRVSRILATELELDHLLRRIIELASEVLDAERSSLFFIDEQERQLWSVIAEGVEGEPIRIPVGTGLAGYVAATGETINVPDAYRDARFDSSFDRRTGCRTRCVLAMPIRDRLGTLLGVIQVLNKSGGRTFNAADVSLLETFTSHAAVAIERSRLVESQMEQLRVQESLSLARAIQLRMLRGGDELQDHRIQLYAELLPAEVVGGDLYDFFSIDEHRVGFAVGDVSGKGFPAALFMAGTLNLLRSAAEQRLSPAECVDMINRVQRNDSAMFVTLFYGILDLWTGRIDYCNAGHQPPVVFRSSGKVALGRRAENLPAGLLRRAAFEQGHLQLGRNDVLILYTDGVTEAQNERRDMFGEAGVVNAVYKVASRDPVDVVTGIRECVADFAAAASPTDDVTLLALHYTGSTA